MMVRLAICASLAACAFGGGPYIGYGKKGVVAGAEGSVGVGAFQTTVGFDRFRHVFGRFDLGFDNVVVHDQAGLGPAFRVGAGVVGGGDVDHHFAFVFGFGAVEVFGNPRCQRNAISGALELQLRYTDGPELVLAPRIDSFDDRCFN